MTKHFKDDYHCTIHDDDVKELADALNVGKQTETGFILLSNIGGFQVFEIDKTRLQAFLQLEAIHKKTGTK